MPDTLTELTQSKKRYVTVRKCQ